MEKAFWIAVLVSLVAGVFLGSVVFTTCNNIYNDFKAEQIKIGYTAGYGQALNDVVNKVITTGGIQINIVETNQSIRLVLAPS